MRYNLTKTKRGLMVIVPVIALMLITITFTLSACTNTGANSTAGSISRAIQPNFQVIGLGVNPAAVNPGEEVQVIATITNSGNADGEYTADLKINGATDEIRKVNLPAGTSQEIQFRLSRANPQVYQVNLGQINGQFEVKAPQQNTSTTGASCCSPATPAAAGNPTTGQPIVSQPVQTQTRSCCQ